MLSEAHPNLSYFITVAFPRTCRPGSPSRATAKARRCNHGAELCKKKSVEPLTLLHLPKGLLPLEGMEEVGYNRATGFVWLKQRKATNHVFKTIEKAVSYAAEVTAFVEDRRMSRMTGVKSKELLVWVSISEMSIHEPESKKIVFKTPAGLSRSFPVSAFEEEEEEEQYGDVDGK
ncbi:hypothetical protein GW17_00062053 [Ensete ventricosum]|nr:hypothetical protein GW17_00062053 [Ensete ventricosum]